MKVLFLDRDDTLNIDPGYLNDQVQVKLLPGVVEGLSRLREADFHFIILTNQSGVGRGLITFEQLDGIHRRLFAMLEAQGIPILDRFYCPHIPDEHCSCRKPAPGLLWKALESYPQIEIEKSWIAGDRYRDLQPGLRTRPDDTGAVLRGILVGSKSETGEAPANLVFRATDLKEAAERILSESPV